VTGARTLSERKRAQAARIAWLAKALGVEILAHFYQRAEVKDLADHVGGSRGLYGLVQATSARRVLVCGVDFMAAAMERLRPDVEFLVPRSDAACPMSRLVGAREVAALRASAEGPARPLVVADIKASGEVRDLADLVLTGEPVWPAGFRRRPVHVLPCLSSGDPGRVPHHDHPGAVCEVHRLPGPGDVEEALAGHGGRLLVAANSLCRPEVRAMADFVGDSQSIWDWCAARPGSGFLVVCESGLVESLSEAFPESRFLETGAEVFCPNMKLVNIKDVLAALETVGAVAPGRLAAGLPAAGADS
jgi:quinolinate synthase